MAVPRRLSRGLDLPCQSTSSASTSAPDASRKLVKLAASMLVCFNAIRQSSELPANASIAKSVSAAVRPAEGLAVAWSDGWADGWADGSADG